MRAKLVEDYLTQHFQIYKNNDKSSYYNYIVLKGDQLYSVRLEPGHKMQWKYEAQIYKPTYTVNGILIKNPSKKMIFVMQNVLKPIRAVRDSINVDETQHFQRGLDPKEAMGIGGIILTNLFDEVIPDQSVNVTMSPNEIRNRWYNYLNNLIKGKTIKAKTKRYMSYEEKIRTIKVKNVIKSDSGEMFFIRDEKGSKFRINPDEKMYIID